MAWGDTQSRIWLAYINQSGQVISKTQVANGFSCGINTDIDGNVHLAYNHGGIVRYRKIDVSGGNSNNGDDILMMIVPTLQAAPPPAPVAEP